MAIRGSLREASLADVVQLLALGKKTGCLSVTHRQHFGHVYLERGRICYASIVNRRDRLGDLLVKHGVVTREVLDDAVSQQGSEPEVRLGEILISRGLLAREQLHRHIRLQIEEAVYFLFTWTEGTFSFEPDVTPDVQDLVVSINPEALLLEGARRVDEWSLIEKKVPSFDVVFELDRVRLAESGVALTPEQENVAALLDGRRDVTSLVDESGLGEFDVGKALYALACAGLVHRVSRATPMVPAAADARVSEHRNLGVAFYRSGMLDEAEREFRRVGELRPGDAHAAFFLALALARRGRWDDVVSTLRPIAERGDAAGAVHHNLALALERLGRPEEAGRALAHAFAASTVDPRTHLSAATLALGAGDLPAAEHALAAAAAAWGTARRPAAWYHAAAIVKALAGDPAAAAVLLEAGAAVHPRSAVLLNNLAWALEQAGDGDGALGAVERGEREEDASLPQLHRNHGDLHLAAGRIDEALASYERAVRHEVPEAAMLQETIASVRARSFAADRTPDS